MLTLRVFGHGDRLRPSGRELERVVFPRFLVAAPDRSAGLRPDLLREAGGDQLVRDLLRRAALQRRRKYEAAVLALGCGAQYDELRVGEFDGHGLVARQDATVPAPNRNESV